jgi:hypothetical protein
VPTTAVAAVAAFVVLVVLVVLVVGVVVDDEVGDEVGDAVVVLVDDEIGGTATSVESIIMSGYILKFMTNFVFDGIVLPASE